MSKLPTPGNDMLYEAIKNEVAALLEGTKSHISYAYMARHRQDCINDGFNIYTNTGAFVAQLVFLADYHAIRLIGGRGPLKTISLADPTYREQLQGQLGVVLESHR